MKKVCIFLFLFSVSCLARAQSPYTQVIEFILQKFDTYEFVALGERHWGQLDSDLRVALVQHPDFPQKVDDILIEFGNSLYQDVLDRYVFGEAVSYQEVAKVWQNTTQIGTWEPAIYGMFIKAIRERNLGLPPEQKIRVLAGGLPIDWANITNGQDHYDQVSTFPADRGSYPVLIAQREILPKNRKALVIFGHNQIDKSSGQVIAGIDQLKPESTYSIGTVRPYFGDDRYFENTYPDLEEAMVLDLQAEAMGSWAAYRFFGFKKMSEGSLNKMLDALLYFGNLPDERAPTPEISSKHEAELLRRRRIRQASWRIRERSKNEP